MVKWIRGKSRDQVNYACIMMEGLFNTLGHDIIGQTTIIPLFLSALGASYALIGNLQAVQSIISAVSPLLFGGLVAAARSKRRISLTLNGVGRGLMLVIPIALLLGVVGNALLIVFFAVMVIGYICQPVTGISWSYLLSDCVSAQKRGRLLGTLFAVSGLISFLSSNVVKAVRTSPSLSSMNQFAVIFALGGGMMALSVLCFLPLKESTEKPAPHSEQKPAVYLRNLLACFRNRAYDCGIVTQVFSNLSNACNAFFFLFAQNTLKLDVGAVSNLMIVQTLGIMAGGFVTGRVSARFGIKRMLMMTESLAGLVPALGLLALSQGASLPLAMGAAFVMGFSRSGMMGYQAYMLEVVDKEKVIYHIVAKSMALLPLSLAGGLIGGFLMNHSFAPLFLCQIGLCLTALFCASRLKLTTYPTEKE